MGYFSQCAMDSGFDRDDWDRSYPSPSQQAAWRLEDLQERLRELEESGAPYHTGAIFSEEDLKYGDPDSFTSVEAILAAMELARAKAGQRLVCPTFPTELPQAAQAQAA